MSRPTSRDHQNAVPPRVLGRNVGRPQAIYIFPAKFNAWERGKFPIHFNSAPRTMSRVVIMPSGVIDITL